MAGSRDDEKNPRLLADQEFPDIIAELGIVELDYSDFVFIGHVADGGYGCVYKYHFRSDPNRYVAMKVEGFN
jgi:hypothetical protein